MRFIFIISILLLGIKQLSFSQDSSLTTRFKVSLLSEYDKEGRWVFIKIDSCGEKEWREVINPYYIFKSKSDSALTSLTRESFVYLASINLIEHDIFAECIEENIRLGVKKYYPLIGHGFKINMDIYNSFNNIPINKILSKYFNKEKELKKKYYKYLHELIAVCYTNNIKVITLPNKKPFYEIFE